jgi:hypothetical protein
MSLSAIYLLLASAATQTPHLSQGQTMSAQVAVKGRVEGSCHGLLQSPAASMSCNVPSVRASYSPNASGATVYTIRPAL